MSYVCTASQIRESNNWWRFRKILWPSQNIWTLLHKGLLMQDWVFRLGLLKHRSWSKRNFHKDPEFFHWTFRKLFLRPHRKASEAETIKAERKNPCTCQIWAKFFFTFFLKNWHKVLYLYLQFMFSKKVTKICQNLPVCLKGVCIFQTFWKKEGKEVKIVFLFEFP